MDNPETLATSGTQDTGLRQTNTHKKTTAQHNTTQKTKMAEQHGPQQKLGVNFVISYNSK